MTLSDEPQCGRSFTGQRHLLLDTSSKRNPVSHLRCNTLAFASSLCLLQSAESGHVQFVSLHRDSCTPISHTSGYGCAKQHSHSSEEVAYPAGPAKPPSRAKARRLRTRASGQASILPSGYELRWIGGTPSIRKVSAPIRCDLLEQAFLFHLYLTLIFVASRRMIAESVEVTRLSLSRSYISFDSRRPTDISSAM